MVDIKSLPKLTSLRSSHTYEIELKRLPETIKHYVDEYGLELNPDFQRGYVWTLEQKIKFIEFLLKGGETTPLQFNHPGWMNSFAGEFVCVDGLQRLTAILEFSDNQFPVFDNIYRKDISSGWYVLMGLKIRINTLKTRKEVLQWYVELNSGGTVHTREELEKVRKMIKKIE